MQTGMKHPLGWIPTFLVLALAIWACTDPTEIGADLLEGDKAEVGFTDTLSLIATTEKTDTVLTYFPVFQISEAFRRYACGEMDDPIFGKVKTQIFAQLSLTDILPTIGEDAVKIDSFVLVLPYDSAGLYGDVRQPFGFSIHRMTEDLDDDLSYYSNVLLQSNPTPLRAVQFFPRLDTLTVIDYSTRTDTVRVPPQLRVHMPMSLAQELVQLDTSFYRSDSAFVSYFKGFHFKPTTVNPGLISFNLTDARGGLYLYYERADGAKRQYRWTFNPFRARAMRFDHDYKGSTVERYINNPQLGDSLVFIQGLAGVITKLEIPNIQRLKGLIINKAELEVRIADLPGDNLQLFKPLPQIILFTQDANGTLTNIDDVTLLLQQGGLLLDFIYDGRPRDGKAGEPRLYRMNIATHLQGMIDGRRSNVLYMSMFNRAQTFARVPLYGARHPQYAIKLKVAFTRL